MKALLCSAAIAALALTGCSKGSEPAPDPLLTTSAADPLPDQTAPANAAASASPAAGTAAGTAALPKSIPNAMVGRWALVPADCTSTKGDAKGLMIIGAATIRFYESTANLAKVTERTDTMLRAQYAFSGEGMEWQREMVLKVAGGGKKLIREEFGQDAAQGPMTYTSCS